MANTLITAYREKLEDIAAATGDYNAGNVRNAFQNLLSDYADKHGQEVMRVDMRTDDKGLEALLDSFFSYERPEIQDFRRALEQFQNELPTILKRLREEIAKAAKDNPAFRQKRLEFLELCRDAIDPKLKPDDVREMIIQHILTDQLFTAVFTAVGDSFHKENAVAERLAERSGCKA